jgi:hypothetical protein
LTVKPMPQRKNRLNSNRLQWANIPASWEYRDDNPGQSTRRAPAQVHARQAVESRPAPLIPRRELLLARHQVARRCRRGGPSRGDDVLGSLAPGWGRRHIRSRASGPWRCSPEVAGAGPSPGASAAPPFGAPGGR